MDFALSGNEGGRARDSNIAISRVPFRSRLYVLSRPRRQPTVRIRYLGLTAGDRNLERLRSCTWKIAAGIILGRLECPLR